MKKALSLFLVTLMLFSVFSVSTFALSPSIDVGEHTLPSLEDFYFTPTESGWYSFVSSDNIDYDIDPYIQIYREDDASLDYYDDDVNDDNYEFDLYEYFEEGVKYTCYLGEYDDLQCDIHFDIIYRGQEYDEEYDSDISGDDYNDDSGIESFYFTPAEPIVLTQYIDGYYERCYCNSCEDYWFFVYNVDGAVHKEGNKVTVNYDDGTTKEFIYSEEEWGFYSADGDEIFCWVDDNQLEEDSHWGAGKTYDAILHIEGVDDVSSTFQVSTKASNIKSVKYNSLVPLELFYEADGYWDTDYNDEEFFVYEYEYNLLTLSGQSVTVEYLDGTKRDFKCMPDSNFYNHDLGYDLPFITLDNQYEEHWDSYGTYNVTFVCLGKTINIPLKVVENPVKSISFTTKTPITFIANTGGEWDVDYDDKDFFYYEIYEKIYAVGNTLTATYTDGRVVKYDYNSSAGSFVNSKGERYDIDWNTNQYENHWYPGKTYNVIIYGFGRECTIPVAIAPEKPATPKVSTTNEIGGVQVNWNKVAGATKYNVYRRQGGYKTWTLVGTTTGNTLLDKNVKSGVYYCYSVRAYNSLGKYSDFVQANTQTRKYMATPKLTTIYNHVNGLAIKWNAVAGVTNGYRVYRRGAGSTYWTYLGTTKNLYFIDNAVKNKSGEYFRYTVIADGGYHSKFDTTGLYLRRLANPTLTSAVSSTSGITVKWGAIKGTTGYYVYRKTANSSWVRVAAVGGTNNTTFLDKTAKKGTTYTYTVRAVYGSTTSAYNAGISCYDKY